jgi:hypothetical protein
MRRWLSSGHGPGPRVVNDGVGWRRRAERHRTRTLAALIVRIRLELARVIQNWAFSRLLANAAAPRIRSARTSSHPNPSCRAKAQADGPPLPHRRLAGLGISGHASSWITHKPAGAGLRSRLRRLRRGGLEHGTVRHQPAHQIAPQRHRQLAGERHDRNPPHPPLLGADPRLEPSTQRAVRLIAQPQPGELDQARAGALPALAMPWSRRVAPLAKGCPVSPT